ncbi:V-type ATPase assembly factor PKR1 [[Candida] zeylanoides]
MGFLNELWDSVFEPGTNPALIKATHASFVSLIVSLVVLVYMTRSVHFVNLLVIASLLYATVVWFIGELQRAKDAAGERTGAAAAGDASGASKPDAAATATGASRDSK